jgi:Lon protease-like protein
VDDVDVPDDLSSLAAAPAMPMFPLGNVLFPSVFLPLHVFEPRYRTLVRHCLEGEVGEPEFGVVLIERGSEVGGGDVRSTVGTVARIVEARQFEDGRWALGTVGVRRVKVVRWLDDAPYPRAEVEDWPDPPVPEGFAGRLAEVVAELRAVLAERRSLGLPAVDPTVEFADDPSLASFQAAACAPVGPADDFALLAAPDAPTRTELLARLLADERELLRFRLLGGGDTADGG